MQPPPRAEHARAHRSTTALQISPSFSSAYPSTPGRTAVPKLIHVWETSRRRSCTIEEVALPVAYSPSCPVWRTWRHRTMTSGNRWVYTCRVHGMGSGHTCTYSLDAAYCWKDGPSTPALQQPPSAKLAAKWQSSGGIVGRCCAVLVDGTLHPSSGRATQRKRG